MFEKNPPFISVIIANYNSADFIEACLRSILEEKNNNYEIIIVDDNSQDESVKLITKKYGENKKINLIQLAENVGAAKVRNIGAKKSKGNIFFFLDCDTILMSGWYKKIVHFFTKYSDAGMAQAKILKIGSNQFDYAGDYLNSICFLTERAQSVEDRGQFDKVVPIFSVKGAAIIVKKTIFNRVGKFDEDYEYYWEEPDLAWRIWLAGFKVYFFPQVVVRHAYITKRKDHAYYTKNDIIYKSSRNAISTLIKNLELKNLLVKLPLHVLSWLILAIFILIKGQWLKSFSIIKGVLWNLFYFNFILKKRRKIQLSRKITDEYLFKIVGTKKPLNYYFRKAFSYISGRPF